MSWCRGRLLRWSNNFLCGGFRLVTLSFMQVSSSVVKSLSKAFLKSMKVISARWLYFSMILLRASEITQSLSLGTVRLITRKMLYVRHVDVSVHVCEVYIRGRPLMIWAGGVLVPMNPVWSQKVFRVYRLLFSCGKNKSIFDFSSRTPPQIINGQPLT